MDGGDNIGHPAIEVQIMSDKNKVEQASNKIQDVLDKLIDIELTATVSNGDMMILLRKTYDSLQTCKTNLDIIKDSMES